MKPIYNFIKIYLKNLIICVGLYFILFFIRAIQDIELNHFWNILFIVCFITFYEYLNNLHVEGEE